MSFKRADRCARWLPYFAVAGICLLAGACLQNLPVAADEPRERRLFDFDWRFIRGDVTVQINESILLGGERCRTTVRIIGNGRMT